MTRIELLRELAGNGTLLKLYRAGLVNMKALNCLEACNMVEANKQAGHTNFLSLVARDMRISKDRAFRLVRWGEEKVSA